MDERFIIRLHYPITPITVTADCAGIAFLDMDEGEAAETRAQSRGWSYKQAMPYDVQRQLDAYFSGSTIPFTLPLSLNLTAFRTQILMAVSHIPYGETVHYSGIADTLGEHHTSRVIGQALSHNPLPILIPCHRVIGKNGLGGYCAPIVVKEALLRLENAI